MSAADGSRRPILYIAPWVDLGGTDTGTIDWFRWIDREVYAPSLVTTQPSPNRRLDEVFPFADEVWPLPDLIPGPEFPGFILDFVQSRGIEVVHIMNSRLGFDLIPDLKALPAPPRILVQLHVEEPDRGGYVRYVAARYGNLVDAFSVVSQHLADGMVKDYFVPARKTHLIYLGVDSERFNAERVLPTPGLEPGPVHILYAGRLVEQKDPMLMVEVAAQLRQRTAGFRVHCVGDGHLEPAVRAAIAAHGLEDVVLLHGPATDTAPWYRACDLLLMTSAFEGLPCVVYEAMAMGLPVVVPAVGGNAEVVDEAVGALIQARVDATAYADSLEALVGDAERRAAAGIAARDRCRSRFSAERSADEHAALYADLLASGARPAPAAPADIPHLRFPERHVYDRPLVSIVIPCFNQGRWLQECLASIREQTYPRLEVIVVDDASDDPETRQILDGLGNDGAQTVIRLEANQGPAVARNIGIERAQGRYVLPVDADNLLLPDAVMALVDQLQQAGDLIGFIYPNQQFFGTRDDYSEAPEYNLHNLLLANFCDTSSLIDNAVFKAGLRYPTDIKLGHEDWDFALALADRGVRGQPAREKTLLTRKWGFTRSDLVEQLADDYFESLRRRHAPLYDDEDHIKARWSPALSIVALDEVPDNWEVREALRRTIAAQTAVDAEVILRDRQSWQDPGRGVHVRRLAPELGRSEAEAVATGLAAARGRFLLVTDGNGVELMSDPAFVEKLLRIFLLEPATGAVAFLDAGAAGGHPMLRLDAADVGEGVPFAVAWSVHWTELIPWQELAPDACVAQLSLWLSGSVPMQWRHLSAPRTAPRPAAPGARPMPLLLRGVTPVAVSRRKERDIRLHQAPLLGRVSGGSRRLLQNQFAWMPTQTLPLCRHRSADGRRVVTTTRQYLPGFFLEYTLGAINLSRLPGTVALVKVPGGEFVVREGHERGDGDVALGYLETVALPLLDAVHLGRERGNGQMVLVAGDDDPLLPSVELLEFLGWIEPNPIRPRRLPYADVNGVLPQAVVERDRLIAVKDEEIGALWARVNGIHNSVPGRVYSRLKEVPGLKAALLGRRRGHASAQEQRPDR